MISLAFVWTQEISRWFLPCPPVCTVFLSGTTQMGTVAVLSRVIMPRLHGLWEGIVALPPPPDPPFNIETQEWWTQKGPRLVSSELLLDDGLTLVFDACNSATPVLSNFESNFFQQNCNKFVDLKRRVGHHGPVQYCILGIFSTFGGLGKFRGL